MLLEQLHYERGVVAFAHESFVKLELLALEVEVNIILLIDEMEQPLDYDAFALHDELFRLE